MNGDLLSQEEIDALLRGENLYDKVDNDTIHHVEDYLNEIEQDAIGELGNISFGSSATTLSTILNQKVEITTPSVSIIRTDRLDEEFPQPCVAITVKYTEGFSGINILVIKQTDAAIIADIMLGGDGTNPSNELDELHLSAVQEAMNQMMGAAATSMSSIFNKRVDISPPVLSLMDIPKGQGVENFPDEELLVKVSFRLTVGSLIDSEIMQILPIDFAKNLVGDLIGNSYEQESSTEQMTSKQNNIYIEDPIEEITDYSSQFSENFGRENGGGDSMGNFKQEKPNIQKASFMDFDEDPQVQSNTKNLDILLDIPLQVTVELGKTSRTVKDILELGTGSIIELDKLAGEPVDILVNNRLIAKGEVVVIDENFGVRVTDIANQETRIKGLK